MERAFDQNVYNIVGMASKQLCLNGMISKTVEKLMNRKLIILK